MTLLLNVIIPSFVYITTVIASLRAASRAIYISQHEGSIGLMDGPLILSPNDVLMLMEQEEQVRDESYDKNHSSSILKYQVSPLWMSSYGFQQAVSLSLAYDEEKRDYYSDLNLFQNLFPVTVTSKSLYDTKEQLRHSTYLLSAPHKSSLNNNHHEPTARTLTQKQIHSTNHESLLEGEHMQRKIKEAIMKELNKRDMQKAFQIIQSHRDGNHKLLLPDLNINIDLTALKTENESVSNTAVVKEDVLVLSSINHQSDDDEENILEADINENMSTESIISEQNDDRKVSEVDLNLNTQEQSLPSQNHETKNNTTPNQIELLPNDEQVNSTQSTDGNYTKINDQEQTEQDRKPHPVKLLHVQSNIPFKSIFGTIKSKLFSNELRSTKQRRSEVNKTRNQSKSTINKRKKQKQMELDYDVIVSTTVPIPYYPLTQDGQLILMNQTSFTNDNAKEDQPSTRKHKVAHIKAYAPQVFSNLRSRFGIDEEKFIKSIFNSGPFVSFQSNSKGAARSGGFFFFTQDGRFMIKTIKKAEVQAFLNMLPKYNEYMRRNAKQSLLTRFFGMYSVKIADEVNTQKKRSLWTKFTSTTTEEDEDEEEENVFVIMNSVFPAEGSKFITERFDLKGSTVGRECSPEERLKKGRDAVLKDLDLDRETEILKALSRLYPQEIQHSISIGAKAKASLISQIRKDVGLLVECKVMDYSLLVGVVDMDASLEKANEISRPLLEYSGEQLKKNVLMNVILSSKNSKVVNGILYPLKQISAPSISLISFMGRKVFSAVDSTLSTILTLPLPYYGAGVCAVDGGRYSIIHGKRLGNKATFYLGIIDFLQPWTFRKLLERDIKGLVGYDKKAISCVHPTDYAARFIDFIDNHIS